MSRGLGSSVISITVFLAILLIAVPAGADNATTNATLTTTLTAAQATTNVTPAATTSVTPAATTIVPTETGTVTQPATTAPPMETTTAATATTAVTPSETLTATTAATTPVAAIPTSVAPTANPTTGTMIIYSSPPGASILIDGAYSGTTPRTVYDLPAGTHILRLALSGYYDYEGSIYVVPGQTDQAFGTLQPIGQMAVTPVPTAVVTVFVPVTAPTQEPAGSADLFGDAGVVAAIIGAFGVVIVSAAKIFTHVRPPKKE